MPYAQHLYGFPGFRHTPTTDLRQYPLSKVERRVVLSARGDDGFLTKTIPPAGGRRPQRDTNTSTTRDTNFNFI